MPYISRKSRKYILLFTLAIAVAVLYMLINRTFLVFMDFDSIIYICLTVVWIITIQRRMTIGNLRHYIVLGGSFMISLFIMRLIRWTFYSGILILERLFWYFYYVSIIVLPLLSILLAINVGIEEKDRNYKLERFLKITAFIIIAFVVTNDLHNLIFNIKGYVDGKIQYSYSFGYFIVIAWCVILSGASLLVLIKRSNNTAAKKLSWIPAAISLFFTSLLFVYIVRGGSAPKVFGHKLYNFQEVYSLVFVGLWESCLRIGLIPSNSDYDGIFRLSSINAAIADDKNNIKYRSNEIKGLSTVQIDKADKGDVVYLDENSLLRTQHIAPTGKVIWIEDHTTINELNDELKEALDRISEENNLLEMENDIKAQKAALETRSKLYDGITLRTKGQLEKIEEILEKIELTGRNTYEGLMLCSLYGAYAKRQANLSILSEQFKKLKLEELRYAIRESLENVKLLGIDANVSGIKADTEFDGELLIYAYEVFEATLEAALPNVETISCILLGDDGIKLEILMDTPFELPDFASFNPEKYGMKIEVLKEDEGIYVRLSPLKISEVSV